jgi:hypothetical protein
MRFAASILTKAGDFIGFSSFHPLIVAAAAQLGCTKIALRLLTHCYC